MNSIITNEITEKLNIIKYSYWKYSNEENRRKYSQYLTPVDIATMMSRFYENNLKIVRILDPGAGTGILSAALIIDITNSPNPPTQIELVAVEIDDGLNTRLTESYEICKDHCKSVGISFSYKIINQDFIEFGYSQIESQFQNSLFKMHASNYGTFDAIITNPPYKKIKNTSRTRNILKDVGIETTNMYTAFLSISKKLLSTKGTIIAITPRSFCNGVYFKKFRNDFFENLVFKRIHIFNRRDKVFKEDDVLQENIIFSVAAINERNNKIQITTSESPDDDGFKEILVDHDSIISPDDPDKVIHIISDEYSLGIVNKISSLGNRLEEIGLNVSTGKVVDFRAVQFITETGHDNSVPLIYPFHLVDGGIVYPKNSNKKKEALIENSLTEQLLIPNGYYVLCKRFSSKEEKKRIVASVLDEDIFNSEGLGIENHLNYYHKQNRPLEELVAKGLNLFLNSTLVDQYFRLFNGHTQVNAEDLRYIPYPTLEQLKILGDKSSDKLPSQEEIDSLIDKELFRMAKDKKLSQINKKITESMDILKSLGLPKDQQNERSALTLLALLNLKPNGKWNNAQASLIGITPIMDFIRGEYKKDYAANTRESIRRQTMHQFVQAGIVIPNPDEPKRPTNSPKFVYQIDMSVLKLLREYKTKAWDKSLSKYLTSIKTLSQKYAQERKGRKIPLEIADQLEIYLSPGKHNELINKIINEFCPFFTPNGVLIYVGDTGEKWAYFNDDALKQLNISIKDQHGKMPDVVVYFKKMNWLILIEAVTSHGPIDPKRKIELEKLFSKSTAGLVFITAFIDKKTMLKYLSKIAWETDIWIAEDSTHLIHLNGKRFLGPY